MERFIKPWLPPPNAPNYTFINANIVDIVTGSFKPLSTVRLRDGRIASITAESPSPPQDDEFTIDLHGKYLMPGLIGSHVHLSATPGESELAKMLKPDEMQTAFRIPHVCREMLRRGFTTVRDCGGAPTSLKSAVAEWLVPGPRVILAGHALTQRGGHGDFRERHEHRDPECPTCGHFVGLARIVDGVPDAISKSRDELRQGADSIKIMGSGGMTMSDQLTMEQTQFTPEETRAIVETAAAGGTYATVHAYAPHAIRQAIMAGAKGIEHGNLLDRDTAKLMAEKGVCLTPTLVTFAIAAEGPGSTLLSSHARETHAKFLKAGFEAIRLATEEGVDTCFGTDLLGPVGVFQSREFLRSELRYRRHWRSCEVRL